MKLIRTIAALFALLPALTLGQTNTYNILDQPLPSPAQAANSVLGNGTGAIAVPNALLVPSCSAAASALTWTTNTGFGCNTIASGDPNFKGQAAAPTVTATGTNSLAAGSGASVGTGSTDGIAIGTNSAVGTSATQGIAIGKGATVGNNDTNAIVIGNGSTLANSASAGGIVIGGGATSNYGQSVLIGNGTSNGGSASIAIGDSASATNRFAIAIGYFATTSNAGTGGTGPPSIAIGEAANAGGSGSTGGGIAVGYHAANDSGSDPIAIGNSSSTVGNNAVAIGTNATAAANSLDVRWATVSGITGDSTGKAKFPIGFGLTTPMVIATAPTLASGGCATPQAVTTLNGTALFKVSVGSGACSGSQPLVFTLPAATTEWFCHARNITNGATSSPAQTGAISTTSVTITNFVRTTGVAGAWTTSDVVEVSCVGG